MSTVRLRELLLGPRIIDPGLRLLVLVIAIGTLLPGSFEYDSPVYIATRILAAGLTVVTAFWPGTVGLLASVATELDVSFAWGYTGALLVMLLISAVRLIRDRRTPPRLLLKRPSPLPPTAQTELSS